MTTTITVPGGSSVGTVSLVLATRTTAALATVLLNSVYAAAAAGTLVGYPQPTVAGAVNEYVIAPSVTGSVTVPAGDNTIVDAAVGNVTITGNGAANESIIAGGGNLEFNAAGGSGTIVAGAGADTIIENTSAFALLGDATYTNFTGLSTGPALTDGPPAGTSVVTGYDTFTQGTGSGANTIYDAGDGDNTIVIDADQTTVTAVAGGGFYYEYSGTLTFIDDIGGNYPTYGGPILVPTGSGAATIVGSSGAGAAVIFAGSNPLDYIQASGTAAVTFVNGSASSTVMAGAAGGILAFDGAGGTLALLGSSSSAFNYLVGGAGAETLNAAFAGSTAVLVGGAATVAAAMSVIAADAFFAGAGAATVTGSALPDLYAFANGGAGGSDVILDWGPTSGLVFLGYGASGDAAITRVLAATSPAGAVSFTLPDNTTVTIVGAGGSTVNLGQVPTYLS